jgi:hypothetical protein
VKIYSAFVRAQQGFAPALKTSTNPHFKSKYADLAACVEAVIDALNTNGIGLIQKTHQDDSGVTVETVFVHESGESMSGGVLHVPASKQDPQGYGSALSYARRYSLMAACGIAPEDDDGNAASKPRDLAKTGTVRHAVRDGIGEDLPAEDKAFLGELAEWCAANIGKPLQVAQHIATQHLDSDQRVYLENQLDSKARAAIKKAEGEIRAAFTTKEPVAA